MFMGKVWKTFRGPGQQEVRDIWAAVLHRSYIGQLLLSSSDQAVHWLSFEWIAILLWLCMGFQVVYTLMLTIPIGPKTTPGSEGTKSSWCQHFCWLFRLHKLLWCCTPFKVDYKIAKAPLQRPSLARHIAASNMFEYETFLDPSQNHGAALMMLAGGARLSSVCLHDLDYARAKLRAQCSLLQNQHSSEVMGRYMHIARQQVRHGISMFLFVGFFDAVPQIYLQAVFMGIVLLADNDERRPSFLSMGSLAVNSSVLLLKLANAISLARFLCEIRHDAQSKLLREADDDTQFVHDLCSLSILAACLVLIVILYAIAMVILAGQIIALFACQDHMSIQGCVYVWI